MTSAAAILRTDLSAIDYGTFHASVLDCILPRERVPTVKWAESNLRLPPGAEMRGFYRFDLFPYMREPLACIDDPYYRVVIVQAASRMGKTAGTLAALGKNAATNPHNMAFADADERSTRRVLARAWATFGRCAALRDQLPVNKRERSSARVAGSSFAIEGAWAGSAATAADYAAWLIVLNEVDKMKEKATSTEAAFPYLMMERGKGFVDSTVAMISTPSIQGASIIENERLLGDNRRYMVPCPHCGWHQVLFTGDGKKPGGIRFKKLNGKLDADKARETAYYACERCDIPITDRHRYDMMNAGIYVKEGQDLDEKGRLIGEAKRPKSRQATFGPLGTHYSLLPSISWGTIAEEWVKALTAKEKKRERIRNFINSWDGKTFNPKPVAVEPSDLIERLGVEEPWGVCPIWSRFLTIGVDVGKVGNKMVFHYAVMAWGQYGRGQLIDIGTMLGRDKMAAFLQDTTYAHADGGTALSFARMGVDSGKFTETVYKFCDPIIGCWPIKGSSLDERYGTEKTGSDFEPGERGLDMFKPGMQRAGHDPKLVTSRKKLGKYDLIIPNTHRSQQWLEDRLTGTVKLTDADALTIPLDLLNENHHAGIDLCRQLLGDYLDSRGHWKKQYEDQDIRDAVRYAMVMAFHHRRGGKLWPNEMVRRLAPATHAQKRTNSAPPFIASRRGY